MCFLTDGYNKRILKNLSLTFSNLLLMSGPVVYPLRCNALQDTVATADSDCTTDGDQEEKKEGDDGVSDNINALVS